MKRRNVEGTHEFAEAIAERFNIFELGGLLLDSDWNFTAAVEAFELEAEEAGRSLHDLIVSNGFLEALYMDALFAAKLQIPFYIIAHIQENAYIHIYKIHPDEKTQDLNCEARQRLTEDEFIHWWQEKKGTAQTKPYRSDFQRRAQNSYFDNLLEGYELKWGGNIDGFLVADREGAFEVTAIIENRFTNKAPLAQYDPNNYYKFNGGDYNTWRPLIQLADSLGVPLLLMTYSNRIGEGRQVGITRIIDQSLEDGLLYVQDSRGKAIRPCKNIFTDVDDIQKCFERLIGRTM